MTERTDHAKTAVELVNHPFPAPPSYLTEAQIHATLALVEQQRIANLIAIAQFDHDVDEKRLFTTIEAAAKWRQEAAEGLGLT